MNVHEKVVMLYAKCKCMHVSSSVCVCFMQNETVQVCTYYIQTYY